jgi:hypothetical protein
MNRLLLFTVVLASVMTLITLRVVIYLSTGA